MRVSTRTLALAGLFVAVAYVLSLWPGIPVGPTKVQPFQHTVNAIAGVVLGPWYAALVGLLTASLRVMRGTGTYFAYPGSIPGALIVGLTYQLWKRDWAALTEPLGTGLIGALLGWLIVAPLLGSTKTLLFFIVAFLASSIPGAILGFVILKVLRRVGVQLHPAEEGR